MDSAQLVKINNPRGSLNITKRIDVVVDCLKYTGCPWKEGRWKHL